MTHVLTQPFKAITNMPQQISEASNAMDDAKFNKHMVSLAFKALGVALVGAGVIFVATHANQSVDIAMIAKIAGFILGAHTALTVGENIYQETRKPVKTAVSSFGEQAKSLFAKGKAAARHAMAGSESDHQQAEIDYAKESAVNKVQSFRKRYLKHTLFGIAS